MAFRWRIRHKLTLGLAMVVSVVGLLLAGTLYGVASFRNIFRSIDSRHAELKAADDLRSAAIDLRIAVNTVDNLRSYTDRIAHARQFLGTYEQELQKTLGTGLDTDLGAEQAGYVSELNKQLSRLEQLTRTTWQEGGVQSMGPKPTSLLDTPAIHDSTAQLTRTADDLTSVITTRLAKRSRDVTETVRRTLWIVLVSGIAGMLLLCGLLRSFYRSLYQPIRDLESGALRLAQGDFDHAIEVHTGDELEDLAHAFNDMTSQLRDTYSDLAKQVNDRSRQLVRSERLASVGFLAAGVAHEINNPLASIAFCSEALEHRLTDLLAKKPDNGEVIAKYLKMIQQEAFRCKAITQRLLEFSRGSERKREASDLADLIQGVLDMVQTLPNCKGKQVIFQNPGPSTAWINAQEIKSVVLNLVVNALDSMDEGGTLKITLGQREGMAEMVFADTGCGMTPAVLENIFEPFFTRSRTGKGTGLGLSISHQVISQHGGEIQAASPGPKLGSTFTVRLPVKAAEVVKEAPLARAA